MHVTNVLQPEAPWGRTYDTQKYIYILYIYDVDSVYSSMWGSLRLAPISIRYIELSNYTTISIKFFA